MIDDRASTAVDTAPHSNRDAALAAQPPPVARPPSLVAHWLAVITAVMTGVLIFVGGVVTNTGSALAVPDWPTTFGHNMFLFPWSQMVGGVLYEHSHRLLGSLVGMLTVALAVWLWVADPRRWVRLLGVVAVVAVIVQGVLGGLRVVLLEHGFAIIHACLAQAFLALIVSLAVVTSRGWSTASPPRRTPDTRSLRALVSLALPLIYLQIVFGAVLTHAGTRLDAHLLGAVLVTVVLGLLGRQVLREGAAADPLRRPATVIVALLMVQISLGLGALLWRYTALSSTVPFEFGLLVLVTHRIAGTAIWATAVVLALRVFRVVHAPATGAERAQGLQAAGVLA